ncbi:SusC/RagA family TonB-linked outer membrane protein [Myroides odoratimimus]|uniref:SusC/RagA family TonB-linked outer membrane protein n=1 Tax=Myroides odoratimimus TaxID=76832 RepID=UPI003101461B
MKLKLYLTFSMLVLTSVVFAQAKKTITGSVKDTDGLPLIGATIVLEGTDFGTSADDHGIFTINAGEGDVLVVSYVFYETQRIRLTSKTHYDIKLKEDGQVLEDVVVVAYGTATKESVTGAIAVIENSEITKRPGTNALAALEGAAPGIRVNNTSGQPGAEPTIRIRGFTSVNGSNSPLLVVDGVPFGGNISDLNPNDIDSMSILKDASASTLYGNRASNGVVLITTKKASKGKGFFGVNLKQGLFTRGMSEYDKLGADDYMETMWKANRNSLIAKNGLEEANRLATETLIPDYLKLNIYNLPADQLFTPDGKLVSNASVLSGYASDLDWFKELERTGMYQDLNMSGRVANEKGGAYFSGSFLNNESYVKNSDYKRFTARINADYKVNDAIKVGANLTGSHQESHGLTASMDDNTSIVNPFYFARNIAPIYPVYLHDKVTGDFVYDEFGQRIYDNGEGTRGQLEGRHTVLENNKNNQQSIRNTVNGQFFADFKFLQDFTFSLKGDMSLRNSEARKYDNALIGDGQGSNGRSRRDIYRYKTYTAQQLLNWNKSFGDHNFDVLVGHENFNNDYSYLYGMKTNQTFEGMDEWINFTEAGSIYDYTVKYRTEGYLSRAKYNYANKYFAEASFRRDGSSKFHKDNRWGNFWSVGGSWIISAEDFFKVKHIDYLKLRVSYGEVGEDGGAGTYGYQSLYSIVKNGGKAGLYKSQNGNDNLQWETSSSFNIGLDGRLFNRVNFTVEYFDKRSQNLLFDLNMPLSNGSNTPSTKGISSITSNVGSISNKGLELSFDVDIIKTADLRWNFAANATWLKNKIAKLPEENRKNGIISSDFKRLEGKSMYEFYLYQFVGVDQMYGDALYVIDDENFNVNGSAPDKDAIADEFLREINGVTYTTSTTYGKREFAGSAIPKVDGSFSTSLNYKNFSLSALFTYSLGSKVYDYSYASLMSVGSSPHALHKNILGSWNGAPEGMTEKSANRIDPNGLPVLDFDRNVYTSSRSDRFLQNGNYLVFKNISLGYDMPKEVTKSLGISSLSFTGTVENVVTFTKLKGMNSQMSFAGQVMNSWAPPRTFIFGVNVGF